MRAILVAVVVGFLAARLVWVMIRPVFAAPLFARENFRGLDVPTGAGAVIALAAIVVEAGRTLVAAVVDGHHAVAGASVAVLLLAVGFGLLGIIDDVAGSGDRRGFRGHVASLAHGRMTTGGLKLVGGAAVSILAVDTARGGSPLGELLVDAVLVALAANLGNLFDRAPGRTIKVGALAFVVLVAATVASPALVPVAIVIGAALGLLLDDLHEHLMLGDAGANVVGGMIGLGVVVTGTFTVRLAVLAVVLILNGASEWVSFSAVIDRVPPLRLLDRAGRRR